MTATKTRVKKTKTQVPKSREDAARFIGEIGARQRRLDEIELRIQARVARAKEEYREEVECIRKERTQLMNGLFSFCETRREELCENGTKTANFATGTVNWRYTPPKVVVEDDQEMVEILHELDLAEDYVRVKEELNREALLADREELDVDGLDFTQREEFVVTPTAHDTEVKKTRTIALD